MYNRVTPRCLWFKLSVEMHNQLFAFLGPIFMKKPRKVKKKIGQPNRLATYFREESTVHGIRYLFDKSLTPWQRTIWGLVQFLCFVGFAWNTTNQLILFASRPVRVDMSVEYFNNMDFPDVTLCNYNIFRQSIATELGYHEYIAELLGSADHVGLRNETKEFFLNNGIEPRAFMEALAHQKEAFIYSCSLGGVLCSAENFSTVFTGIGVCYRFNQSSEDLVRLSESGIQNGLKLVLNVETFDYFRSNMNIYGLKALVHTHDQRPRMDNFGFSVPSGRQALAAVSATKTERIPHHGERPCGENELQLLKGIPYSFSACYDDCYYKFVAQKCECLSLGIGDRDFVTNIGSNVTLKYCDPYTYMFCSKAAATELAQLDAVPCNCRQKCSVIEFDVSISYAEMGKVLFDEDDKYFLKMKDNLIRARNAHSKVHHLMDDLSIFDEAVKAGHGLNNVSRQLFILPRCLKNVVFNLKEYEDLSVNAMTEIQRTVSEFLAPENMFLISTYTVSLWDMKPRFRSLQNSTKYDAEKELLDMRSIVLQIYNDIKQRYQKFKLFLHKHPYFSGASFVNQIEEYITLSSNCFDNLTLLLTIEAWKNNGIEQIDQQRRICLDHQLVNEDIGREFGRVASVSYIQTVEKDILQLFGSFKVLQNASLLSDANDSMVKLLGVSDHIALMKPLYDDYADGNITKLQLANNLTKGSLESDIDFQMVSMWQTAEEHFQMSYLGILKKLTEVVKLGEQMPTLIRKFYKVSNQSLFIDYFQNNSHFVTLVENCSSELQVKYKTKERHLEDYQAVWKSSIKHMFSRMSRFIQSCKLNPDVVKSNFAELNIFFPELKVANIIQSQDYGIWDLLSDVGGGMGLFLGASFITMFEIFNVLTEAFISNVMSLGTKST